MVIRAAGILIVDTKGRALFLKRGPGGDAHGEWCFPGGRLENDEPASEAAVRETEEECGFKADPKSLVMWSRRIAVRGPAPPLAMEVPAVVQALTEAPVATAAADVDQVDFTTFLCKGIEPFTPEIDTSGEHVAYAWCPLDQPPEPLHPGCRIALAKINMDELGIARAIRDGELTSPQYYANVWLFALRITGTGVAYRTKWKEYVWRDPSMYLNDEFLARCNGLAVIFEHPKKRATLDSKEFSDRAVGSVLLPYIKGDEVWGIAKIYDEPTAQLMCDEQLSTSPAVVWRDPDENNKLEMEDGSKLLIEGKPSLLDHLAICALGVWDKGGDPSGVEAVRADSEMVVSPWARSEIGRKLDRAIAVMRGTEIDDLCRRISR